MSSMYKCLHVPREQNVSLYWKTQCQTAEASCLSSLKGIWDCYVLRTTERIWYILCHLTPEVLFQNKERNKAILDIRHRPRCFFLVDHWVKSVAISNPCCRPYVLFVRFWLLCANMTLSTIWEEHDITVPSEEVQSMATGNKNWVKSDIGFLDVLADSHTDCNLHL